MNKSIITIFTQHRVAANILMLMMLLGGAFSLSNLNTQFFPNFALDIITVQVVWPGATAEDIERAITVPLEQELQSLHNIHEMTSTSSESVSSIVIEFEEGSDMGIALDDVKERVGLISHLPEDAETPKVSTATLFENIAKVILTGPDNLEEMRPLAHDIKRQLLNLGIAKIDLVGLPDQEVAIQIPSDTLFELGQSLPDIATKVNALSQDLPAGTAGKDEIGFNLRSPGKKRSVFDFDKISLPFPQQEEPIYLQDIANITQRPKKDEVEVLYQGKPAIELNLMRTEHADALQSAKILDNWLKNVRPTLGESIDVHIFDQSWQLIYERISLLVKNGLGGLALILIILFLFLERHIAFWIAVGIPTSFFAALTVLYFLGGSINMVSLFALIMTLGIIVDDTIVVGENAFARMQKGTKPMEAAIAGAHRMVAPVFASSLTTISAFVPLMLISGIIGNILFDIPFVAICVILASLAECFLVLPGHIYHSFNHRKHHTLLPPLPSWRVKFNQKIDHWRDTKFRQWVEWAITHRWITISLCVSIFMLTISLPLSGRLKFHFFPTPDSTIVNAHIQFIAGTPEEEVHQFVELVRQKLETTNTALQTKHQEDLIHHVVTYYNKGTEGQEAATVGAHVASIVVELTSPDKRKTKNTELINTWRNNITLPPGVENFAIFARRAGPPGQDLDIDLIGLNAEELKAASHALQTAILQFPGVYNVQDNLPFGKPQLIYELTTQGEALGLTTQSVGNQLRAAFDGQIVQIVNQAEDEIEVRVILPDDERDSLATLQYFPIKTPEGTMVPLNTVAQFQTRQGLEALRHTDTLLTVRISGDVDIAQTNPNQLIENLEKDALPKIKAQYHVDYTLRGRSQDQAETFSDMGRGVILALSLIYLILAWVFSSYGWPLAIMAILPFGITGAILGHWLMGIDLTILSLFGFFGLSGIVVNDSIILVSFYRQLRQQGMKLKKAVVEAACQRLRAVILTSLTTIAGLTPLLFETSLQAQFLIPMAVSISFGIAFATLLVLLLVPTLLYFQEYTLIGAKWRWRRFKANNNRTTALKTE